MKNYKLCRKCRKENNLNNKKCSHCWSDKFFPDFLKRVYPITRTAQIQISKPHPDFDWKDDIMSLNRYFMWKTSKFNVSSYELRERIKNIVDWDVAKFLWWETKEETIKNIENDHKTTKSKNINKLIKNHPNFSLDLLSWFIEQIKNKNISLEDLNSYEEIIKTLNIALDEQKVLSFKKLLDSIKNEKSSSIQKLSELLEEWNIRQVTNVSYEVKNRIENIDLFEDRIQDDKTFEIKWDDSIHRILERSMWLLDEKYWIIQSNKSLREFIWKELEKEDKKFQKKRPDFACCDYENKLIIIEIKRPSHSLTKKDLDQLVLYMKIANKYQWSKFKTIEWYLIWNKVSQDLRDELEYRKKTEVMTYSDLLSDCKKRYKNFLKHIEDEKN